MNIVKEICLFTLPLLDSMALTFQFLYSLYFADVRAEVYGIIGKFSGGSVVGHYLASSFLNKNVKVLFVFHAFISFLFPLTFLTSI
jgi:hypothetical protein